jgi:RNase P subunit RPR2
MKDRTRVSNGLYQREAAINAARAEYIKTGKTKNITVALKTLCAERPEMCAHIKQRLTGRAEDRPRTILDDYERPTCRKCGAAMYWQGGCQACKGRVKKNRWTCKECGFIRYTKRTLKEELDKLQLKKQGNNA